MLNLPSAIKYSIIGIVNSIFYGFLVWLFLKVDILPQAVSIAIAFLAAMTFQYIANRIFTFRSSNLFSSEIPKYLTVAGFNYVLTLTIIWIFRDLIGASDFVTVLLVTIICAATGYFLSLFWVFREC